MSEQQLYPMVTVHLHGMAYFRCMLQEWKDMGGYRGFLKDYAMSIKFVEKVSHEMLPASEYPTNEWEG